MSKERKVMVFTDDEPDARRDPAKAPSTALELTGWWPIHPSSNASQGA